SCVTGGSRACARVAAAAAAPMGDWGRGRVGAPRRRAVPAASARGLHPPSHPWAKPQIPAHPRRASAGLDLAGGGGGVGCSPLGPFEVASDGHVLDVGGLKQRALLAILLLHANQAVHRDVLIDQLWGEHPPAGADHAVGVYIWRLRKTLDPVAGSPCVLTRAGGYLLQVTPEQADVARFGRLAEDGHRCLAAGDASRAAGQLREALALWRGSPLADFKDETFAQAEITRLEKLRAEVVEDRIEADLALGQHARVVSELEAVVAAHPLRERPYQQLMIALY